MGSPVRHPRPRWQQYVPAVTGVAAMVASAVGSDVWAVRTDRPTISATGGEVLHHDWLGPVLFGALAGLGWHLVIQPVLTRIGFNPPRGK